MSENKSLNDIGPTGEFPEGKLNPDDAGELKFAIGSHNDLVVIDFNTPVTWLALPPETAREMASHLIRHADDIEK